MKRRVVLSPRAMQHVAAIHDYILEQSGEARADLVVGRLLDVCEGLADFPFKGVQRDDIRAGLRVVGVRRQATIAFVVETEHVVIHGVLGRGRDVNRLFDEDD